MRRLLITAAAVALLASGCSIGGSSSPAGSTPSSSAATGGIVLPPRPRDVPLDGVDPCSLLTPAQREVIGLDQPQIRYDSTAPLFRGPACSINNAIPSQSADIALSLQSGIGALIGPGAVGNISPITVVGFPAIVARNYNRPESCSVEVDVHPHQFLDLQFRGSGSNKPSQDELCRRAIAATEAAVTTLLAR